MTKEEKIEEIRQRARKNFSLGYNCAECVTEAVFSLVDTGLPKEVKKMATGFGGGIGLFGDTCGALVGAVMAVSAVHGRASLPEGEGATIWEAGFVPLVQSDTQSTESKVQQDNLQGSYLSMAHELAMSRTCPFLS